MNSNLFALKFDKKKIQRNYNEIKKKNFLFANYLHNDLFE